MQILSSLQQLKTVKILMKYGSVFVKGLGGTLWMSAVTVFFGTILGILIALMRMGKIKVLSRIASAFVEVIRGLPALMQLYFFWLLFPELMPFEVSDTFCIIVAFIVNASAYISEIIRAGIQAVDKGQWEAARSLGMSESNMYKRIVLPQAIKNILPALCNEFISTIKGTSLASVFFINELTTGYKTVASATFLALQSLCISGVIYLILNITLSKLVAVFERRLKQSDR